MRRSLWYCSKCGTRIMPGEGIEDEDGMNSRHVECPAEGMPYGWEPSMDQLRVIDDLLEEQEIDQEMEALSDIQDGGDNERFSGHNV